MLLEKKWKIIAAIGLLVMMGTTSLSFWKFNTKSYPYNKYSVIVIDMNKNRIPDKIPHIYTKAWFDFDGNGFAHNTEWIKEDFILAYDANHDGKITYGTEFFYDKNIPKIKMLSNLDSNEDGIIDEKDTEWKYLRLFNDKNENGKIEDKEIIYCSNLNIKLNTQRIKLFEDSYDFYDTTLVPSERFTKYSKDFVVSVDILMLPWLRGYGRVHDSSVQYFLNEDFKNYTMQLMKKARLSEGFEIEKDFRNWFKIWVGLDEVHNKYGIKRENFTIDDKVWILENLYGANVHKAAIEKGYSQKLVSNGENEDKYVSSHFTANYNRCESAYIYQVLYVKKIDGAYFDIGSDNLKIVDDKIFNESFVSYMNLLKDEKDIRRIGKIFSYLNSPKEIVKLSLLNEVNPEIKSIFMEEYNKYLTLR
jgi:hypothetical protein